MARSAYIYLIRAPSGTVAGAFTVKYEAVHYWKTTLDAAKHWRLERFCDNRPQVAKVVLPWPA